MAYGSSNRTTSNTKVYKDDKNLRLDNRLSSDKKPVKIGDDITGLLLADNEVFVENEPTDSKHIATKQYVDDNSTVTDFYETRTVNYSGTATTIFLPLAGYIIDRTSTLNSNEYIAMVAPFDGTIERFVFRSEIAMNGTIQFDILESSDGTELPGSDLGTKDTVVNIADDTSVIVDMSSMTTGSNVFTKGRIYCFKVVTPTNSLDTNVALVYKWDMTT